MGTAERRMALLKLVCRLRHTTVDYLANEFDVSERTIRRDIEILSQKEPLYTEQGRYGGVHVQENYYMDRNYMNKDELALLDKIRKLAYENDGNGLDNKDVKLLENLIKTYTKPSVA